MTDIPTASKIESKTDLNDESKTDIDVLMATIKGLEMGDLWKIHDTATSELKKRSKVTASKPTSKKAGSMPKGKVPTQLRRPRAWVDFTLKHALENGWESFTVHQTKKDKETGEKTSEEILQPGSVLHEGAHVYDGSVTEKNPKGKQLIHKDAMSLSKQRWAPKNATGTHQELYDEFLASYVDDDVSETSTESTKVVKMTAAEKEKASEEKKAEKLRIAEEKKEEKQRLAEEKKAEKLRIAEEKKEEKLKTVKPVKPKAQEKTLVPANVPTNVPAKAPIKKKPALEWSCPEDDMVHPWQYKGKAYLRNFQNEVWLKGADGACGEWQGIYMPAEDKIDNSAAEPEFEDE